MKKKHILFILSSILLFSCKKDHSCSCKTTINGIVDKEEITVYPNTTKTTAKSHCLSSTGTSGPGFTKIRECTLQ